jgi:hypothetical protein
MTDITPKPEPNDPLLAALRELPAHAVDAPMDTRLKREARAAYLRSFEPSPWHGGALDKVSRAAFPVFLAGIVGLYMTWAIATATALVH